MKKFAKLLAMVLAVSMVLTMFVGAYNYNDAADIDEDKAAAVETVYNAGIMMGDTEGNFNPKDGLRRSEMAKILFALKSNAQKAAEGDKVFAALNFEDYADIQDWAKAYMGYGFANNLIKGVAEGVADANGKLEFAQAAIMLLRTLGLEAELGANGLPTNVTTYDVGTGDDKVTYKWFEGPDGYKHAITVGYAVGLFKLGETTLDFINYREEISREDVAVMIANAMAKNSALNAIAPDKYPLYNLAQPIEGVITGVENCTIEEETVECFVITTNTGASYVPVDGLKIADYVGRECSCVVEGEDDKGNPIVIGDLLVEVDAPVVDTVVSDIKFIVDEKDLDGDKAKNDIVIVNGDAFVASVEDVDAYYIFKNSVKTSTSTDDYADVKNLLDYENDNGNDNQAVKFVVNANSIAIFYAPYEIIEFNANLVAEEYDDVKGEFTGKLKYNDQYYISEELSKIADKTIVAANVIDGEAFVVGYPTIAKVTDLKTAYSVKDGYTFTLEGEKVVNAAIDESLAEVADADLFEDTLKADNTDCIVVYNGKIVAVFTPKTEAKVETTYTFGFISDIDVDVKVNADEDKTKDGDKYIVTLTVSATVNGTAATYTKEIKTDDIASAMPNFTDTKFYKFSFDAEGKFGGFEDTNLSLKKEDATVANKIDSKKIDTYEIEKLYGCDFIDATGKDLTLADIEVKEVEGKSYSEVYVNGTRINKTDAVAYYYYTFDHDGKIETDDVTYMIVVFDPALKFEVK